MSLFDSIKNKMNEANEELRKREEYIKDMSRGFDILPGSHKAKCCSILAARRIFPLIISTAFAAAAYFAYMYAKNYEGLKWVVIFLSVFIVYYELRNIILFLRLTFGLYDLYGGYVLDNIFVDKRDPKYSKYENLRRRQLKQDNKGIHEGYNRHYYANINGVSCRIRRSQHLLLKTDGYYYVIRIKNRYIINDDFFFIKADSSIENERTGNHFPQDENRKYTPSGGGCISTCSIVFGAISLLVGVVTYFFSRQPGVPDIMKQFSFGTLILGSVLILFGMILSKK